MGATHGKVGRTQSAPKITVARPSGQQKFSLASAVLQPSAFRQSGSQELINGRANGETLLTSSSDCRTSSDCRFESMRLMPPKFSSGGKMSKTSRHTSSRTTSVKLLSLRSRELIKESWMTVQRWSAMSGHSAGILIFDRIFNACPQLRPVFHLTEDEAISLVDQSHPFLRHTKVFTNIIDLAVRNIDELEMQIAPALITYGRRHFYKHHVGFNPMYLKVFANSIVHVIEDVLGDDFDEETSDAWHQLTQYMILKLQHGYDFEGLNRKKNAVFS